MAFIIVFGGSFDSEEAKPRRALTWFLFNFKFTIRKFQLSGKGENAMV